MTTRWSAAGSMALGTAAVLLAGWPGAGEGQAPPEGAGPVAATWPSSPAVASGRKEPAGEHAGARAAGAALRSFVLPGWGQRVLGTRRRMWLFAAVEGASWLVWGERRRQGFRARDRYRDFAWERARLHLTERREADFEYYETLTKWTRSGAFDADPAAPGVQPERDPLAYNGAIWARAVALFLGSQPASEGSPGYEAARAYYLQHAYGDAFLWDWRGDPSGPERLAEMIEESDTRFRQATTALGIVLANHVVAAVDAYLTGADAPTPSLRLTPRPTPLGMGISVSFHFSMGGMM